MLIYLSSALSDQKIIKKQDVQKTNKQKAQTVI